MPAVVKSKVGSFGTSGAEGTTVWPRSLKNLRNARRRSSAVLSWMEIWGEAIRASG